jgi:hypothetical protein
VFTGFVIVASVLLESGLGTPHFTESLNSQFRLSLNLEFFFRGISHGSVREEKPFE